MLRSRTVANTLLSVRDWAYQGWVRAMARRRGIVVSRSSRLFALRGIHIGENCQIFPGAILAATCLEAESSICMAPNGTIKLGPNCVIHTGAIVASYGGKIELGDSVSVNPYSVLYGHGGLRVGNYTRIAAHVTIIPANHAFDDLSSPIMRQGLTTFGIAIGNDVWIGTGARILDGVRIGDGAIVGAGAIVTRDVESNTVVAGSPAKVIRMRGECGAGREIRNSVHADL